MQDRAEASNQTAALDELRRSLAERDEDLEQALREAENGTQQMVWLLMTVYTFDHIIMDLFERPLSKLSEYQKIVETK